MTTFCIIMFAVSVAMAFGYWLGLRDGTEKGIEIGRIEAVREQRKTLIPKLYTATRKGAEAELRRADQMNRWQSLPEAHGPSRLDTLCAIVVATRGLPKQEQANPFELLPETPDAR